MRTLGTASIVQLVITALFGAGVTVAVHLAPVLNSGHCIHLEIAASQEKSKMMADFATAYTNAHPRVDGYCVSAESYEVYSGNAEAGLENGWPADTAPGNPRPDVWSPASSVWVALLEARLAAAGNRDSPIPPSFRPGDLSLFNSPLVIGMPKPMAAALGYPKARLGWRNIFDLATSPTGWATIPGAHPTWGTFKLAKTVPTVSTSGLQALVATYLAAGIPITADGINHDQDVGQAFVGGIEDAVVHYGLTVREFTDNLAELDAHGDPTSYVSAIAMEEQELVKYDAAGPKTLLVPVYPLDGTLVEDHPFVLLNWSAQKADAAADFYRWIEGNEQARIDSEGFRSSGASRQQVQPGGELAKNLVADGGDPSRTIAVLPAVDGTAVDAMLKQWEQLRRPARVMVLVDTAVDAAALRRVLCDLERAAGLFQAQDPVGLATFPSGSGPYQSLVPVAPVGTPRVGSKPCGPAPAILATKISGIVAAPAPANGSTLDVALSAAVASMNATYSPRDINAVLVVDLQPASIQAAALDGLVKDLSTQLDDPKAHGGQGGVRVFTVGPSGDQTLLRIAKAGLGAAYTSDVKTHFLNDVISGFGGSKGAESSSSASAS